MENTNPGVAGRTIGQFPISVAMSLGLEGAFGIHPDQPPPKSPPILEYDELWVNVRTLFRNFLGSLDRTTAGMIGSDEIATTLNEEIEQMTEIVNEGTNGRCKTVFYISRYDGLAQAYPNAILRQDSTPKQMEYTAIQKQTLEILLAQNKERTDPILVFKRKLEPAKQPAPKTLINTHIAYDLLSYRAFRSLSLLESHTGRIKDRALWYTKYSNGKELTQIPFREDLIQIFGDSEIFRPMESKLRKEVLELATRFNWSAVTTLDRIRLCADFIKDALLRERFNSILTAT